MTNEQLSYTKIKNFIKQNIYLLKDYSLGEEDVLLSMTLNLTKDKLLLKNFTQKNFRKIKKIVGVRKKGKPLNKIFKESFFYGNSFYINNNIFIPILLASSIHGSIFDACSLLVSKTSSPSFK